MILILGQVLRLMVGACRRGSLWALGLQSARMAPSSIDVVAAPVSLLAKHKLKCVSVGEEGHDLGAFTDHRPVIATIELAPAPAKRLGPDARKWNIKVAESNPGVES